MKLGQFTGLVVISIILTGCASQHEMVPVSLPGADIAIRGATIYDGSGGDPYVGDVTIIGDRISCVGQCYQTARISIDGKGKAVAPGFINMLSWAVESLIEDGRGMSDLMQGVTLEVFG